MPEVMDAIYYQQGVIRPVVAVVKSIASAIAIGTGAAVGREGPIIQIGAALGSTLGQVTRMKAGQRITLAAAGAGAGIAATFNTPIGGVLFATELMLPEISVNTFLPVAVATGMATFIGRLFFGVQPAFIVPRNLAALPNSISAAPILLLYAALGGLTGVAAAGFVRGLHSLEDGFDLIPGRYIRHGLGMLLVGVRFPRARSPIRANASRVVSQVLLAVQALMAAPAQMRALFVSFRHSAVRRHGNTLRREPRLKKLTPRLTGYHADQTRSSRHPTPPQAFVRPLRSTVATDGLTGEPKSCPVPLPLRRQDPVPMSIRAVIFARYSSDSQRNESIRLCRERVVAEGWTLAQVFRDAAISGATILRPGYQALLEGARQADFEVVVAEALDRLSRDQEDVAALFKRLQYAGIRLITLSEGEISALHVGERHDERAVPEGPRGQSSSRAARADRGGQVRWRQRLRL